MTNGRRYSRVSSQLLAAMIFMGLPHRRSKRKRETATGKETYSRLGDLSMTCSRPVGDLSSFRQRRVRLSRRAGAQAPRRCQAWPPFSILSGRQRNWRARTAIRAGGGGRESSRRAAATLSSRLALRFANLPCSGAIGGPSLSQLADLWGPCRGTRWRRRVRPAMIRLANSGSAFAGLPKCGRIVCPVSCAWLAGGSPASVGTQPPSS